MTSKGTDRHTVRIAPELWTEAQEVSADEERTLSDIIRECLTSYTCVECRSPRGKLIRALADLNDDRTIVLHAALEDLYGQFADEIISRLDEDTFDENGLRAWPVAVRESDTGPWYHAGRRVSIDADEGSEVTIERGAWYHARP